MSDIDLDKIETGKWELVIDYWSNHGNLITVPVTVQENGLALDNHLISWADIEQARSSITSVNKEEAKYVTQVELDKCPNRRGGLFDATLKEPPKGARLGDIPMRWEVLDAYLNTIYESNVYRMDKSGILTIEVMRDDGYNDTDFGLIQASSKLMAFEGDTVSWWSSNSRDVQRGDIICFRTLSASAYNRKVELTVRLDDVIIFEMAITTKIPGR